MKQKDKQGWALIAVVAACLIGILGATVYLGSRPKANRDTNCIGTPTRNTVILIDRSDKLAQQTEDEIMARAMRYIAHSVQVNERVSIFTVSALSKRDLEPAFSKCKPNQERNLLTEGISVEKTFSNNFEKPLKSAIATAGNTSGESPIAQAVNDLTLMDEMNGQDNTLLIFSDMMENTPKFSLYGCVDPDAAIMTYEHAAVGHTERPAFKHTSIFVNIIPRDSRLATAVDCRNKFWTWFLSGASRDRNYLHIDPLPG